MLEVDPPDLRLATTCACPKVHLHVVRHGADVRVYWMLDANVNRDAGVNVIRDVRNCLRCGVELRVDRVDDL